MFTKCYRRPDGNFVITINVTAHFCDTIMASIHYCPPKMTGTKLDEMPGKIM